MYIKESYNNCLILSNTIPAFSLSEEIQLKKINSFRFFGLLRNIIISFSYLVLLFAAVLSSWHQSILLETVLPQSKKIMHLICTC